MLLRTQVHPPVAHCTLMVWLSLAAELCSELAVYSYQNLDAMITTLRSFFISQFQLHSVLHLITSCLCAL